MGRRVIALRRRGSGGRKYRKGLGIILLMSYAMMLNAEQISMTTWYPAPVGVYQSLITSGGTASSPVNTILSRDSGNVGIGTPSPARALDIASNGNAKNYIGMIDTGPGGHTWIMRNGASGNNGTFDIDDVTAGAVRLAITANGSVGIGTLTPDSYFSIKQNSALDGLTISNSAPSIPASIFAVAAPNDVSGQGHLIYTTSGGANRFYVNTNGRVVVGDSGDPNAILYVGGNGLKPGGGSWGDWSDIRLKKNVKPLEGSLQKLLSLRGVTFEWKEPIKIGHRTGPQTGMIAQEVEKVFPEWIDEGKDGFKTLTYRGFEALTVESLRELHTEIEALKSKNAELEKTVRELKQADAGTTVARK